MAGKYKERALGALAGIYGNTAEEAVYPAYLSDASGQILDTSKFNYMLTSNLQTSARQSILVGHDV